MFLSGALGALFVQRRGTICANMVEGTVNPFYNDTVFSKLSLMLKRICCYKEILTITRFPHNNHLVKENIIQMN